MILDLDVPDRASPGLPSWLAPVTAGALLTVALFLVLGTGRAEPAAGVQARPAPASAAVAEPPTRRYLPLSQEQLASRAGMAVLSLPPAVGTVSRRTLSSGVTGLVPSNAVAPGVQVTFTLNDGRIVTLIESTDSAGAARSPTTHVAERVTIRGGPGTTYTAKSGEQASYVVWSANGVHFELWSRTVETAQLRRLAEMLE